MKIKKIAFYDAFGLNDLDQVLIEINKFLADPGNNIEHMESNILFIPETSTRHGVYYTYSFIYEREEINAEEGGVMTIKMFILENPMSTRLQRVLKRLNNFHQFNEVEGKFRKGFIYLHELNFSLLRRQNNFGKKCEKELRDLFSENNFTISEK
jgi:hypothetical protein